MNNLEWENLEHSLSIKRDAELSALMKVTEILSCTMELDKLSRSVIESLDRVISFPYAGFYLYDEDNNILTLVDSKGMDEEECKVSQEDAMSRHPGWVVKNKKLLISNDISIDERISFPQVSKNFNLPGSLCYVPMLHQDKCYGIIGIASDKKNYFTEEHIRLVTAVSRQVAIAFSRINLYQRDKEMVAKLKEVNTLKDEFIANVSHELRTPLTAIIGFSYILTSGQIEAISSVQRELVNDILVSAQNMMSLVEDLLDLSKLQAKKIKLNKKKTDLKAIVQEVITTTKVIADELNVSVESYCEGDFSNVYVDPNRLRQVILNLVTNSIKFNKENGYVKVLLQDKNDVILIRVSDSGIGIKDEDQSGVFEEFRQIEGTGNRKFRGTGLGLSISKKLIELHGGKILLESSFGQGSTFSIMLPKENIDMSKEENLVFHVNSFPNILTEDLSMGHNKKVALLVEDDSSIRKILGMLLKNEFNFLSARDGIEGVAKALRYLPDIILMDLALPNMDGYESASIIKNIKRTSHIPIVALTARVTEDEIDKVISLSYFDKIINKPFRPDNIIMEIKEVIIKSKENDKH